MQVILASFVVVVGAENVFTTSSMLIHVQRRKRANQRTTLIAAPHPEGRLSDLTCLSIINERHANNLYQVARIAGAYSTLMSPHRL